MQRLCLVWLVLLILPACGGSSAFKRERPVKPVSEEKAVDVQVKAEEDKSLKAILKKSVKDMSLAEAMIAKDYYDETGYDEMVMKLIPHIVSISQDVRQIAALTLELADINLEKEQYEAAQKVYTTFVTLYPGDVAIKAARYRQLLTSYLTALEPDRDQSATKNTVNFAQNYIKDFPEDAEYMVKVHAILRSCYRKLLLSELATATFYINKYNYLGQESALDGAQARLSYIESELLPAIGRYDRKLHESRTDLQELLAMQDLVGSDRQAQYAAQIERLENLVVGLEDPWTQMASQANPRDRF
jgi:outer membrane protein assembly factor BamD (BamD/ComL family)